MSKRTWLGGCDELAKVIGPIDCCGSCHHDEEEGYSELWDEQLDDGHDGNYYTTCCGGRVALRAWQAKQEVKP